MAIKNTRKRRREEETESETLTVLLTLAVRNILRAAKKAKTFEIQRLVRKLKDIRDGKKSRTSKDVNVEDLESQLSALKALDPTPLASTTLRSRLLKHPTLRLRDPAHSDRAALIRTTLSPSIDTTNPDDEQTVKARNRLGSSKEVTKAVSVEVEKVLVGLGLAVKGERKGVEPRQTEVGKKGRQVAEHVEEEEEDEDGEDSSSDDSEPPELLGSDLDGAVAAQLANLNPSSSSDSSSESDSESESDLAGSTFGHFSPSDVLNSDNAASSLGSEPSGAFDLTRDYSSSEDAGSDADASLSGSPPPPKPVVKKPKRATVPQVLAPTTSSSFLPSLAAGYTLGDSDGSEFSDKEYERQEREMGRKNRRGQRARRAIWEKKYGKGAKHLQSDDQPSSSSKKDPQSRIARTPAPSTFAFHRGRPTTEPNVNLLPVGARKTFTTSGGNEEMKPEKKVEEKGVHASWEAKRRQRELADVSSAPKGKKITFD